ncbi:twin-arginine leader-binding protein for DmsA and TorA [Enterobacterales bacterium]|nr:twin-arginine leader-binding protein for DmsA and TorA [Enterobacterales bacterium]
MSAESIAATGKILGSLLYFSPDSEQAQPLFHWLQNHPWPQEWPYGETDRLQQIAACITDSAASNESNEEAFQRLFVGPYALPAPPWGSVYLDRESVLFGDSTLNLREWMRSHGIEPRKVQDEPEDQIGLMLMMSAWLAENCPALLDEFLSTHLFPWSFRYLTLLEEGAGHPVYLGIARLARITLEGWQKQCGLKVAEHELYH